MEESRRAKIAYVSHGGGPLPLLGEPGHARMVEFMNQLPSIVGESPEAIVVFSAHWEAGRVTIQSGASPELLYDYYGFPEAGYRLQYPAPGNPELAGEVDALLEQAGIAHESDDGQPYDHGVFVPLLLSYPRAHIPVIQISQIHSLDPLAHYDLGKALRPLLSRNILFLGSGFSFHNMHAYDWSNQNRPDPENDLFQDWLIQTVTGPADDDERRGNLGNWSRAKGARYAHPREEHLLPLHTCAGLAGVPGRTVFDDFILGKRAVGFFWE